jgi:hypothetical protein
LLVVAALLLLWLTWRTWTLLTMEAHSDPRERLIAEDAARVARGERPTLFHWPGTPWTFLLAAFSRVHGEEDTARVVLLGRLGATAFAATSLLLVWAAGRRIASDRGALSSALLLAVSPAFSSGEANIALVDMGALAWSLAAVALPLWGGGVRFRPRLRHCTSLLAGFCVGMAGAFKLPGLFAAAPAAMLVAGHRSPSCSARRRAARLALLGAGAVLGLLVGCPYLLLDLFPPGTAGVLRDLQYEFGHYRRGHFGVVATGRDVLYSPVVRHAASWFWAAGAGVGAACLLGGLFTALRWRRLTLEHRAAATWAALHAGAILVQRISFPRHWLLALPPLLLVLSAVLEAVRRRRPAAAGALLVAAGLLSAGTTVALDHIARQPSTIAAADAWLNAAMRQPNASWSVSYGPVRPVLSWLYPPSVEEKVVEGDVGDADIFVVAAPESALQRNVAEDPGAYRPADFFPRSREDFRTDAFHQRLQRTRDYVRVRRFEVKTPGWMRPFLFGRLSPPFPLNALAHPEIRIYARREVAGRMGP